MSNYYFLVASLPELDFEEGFNNALSQPEMIDSPARDDDAGWVDQLMEQTLEGDYLDLLENLDEKDRRAVAWLNFPIDHRNFITLFAGLNRPFLAGGNYSQEELTLWLEHPGDLPLYFQDFWELYSTQRENSELPVSFLEDQLSELFYREVLHSDVPYLREWYSFEIDLNNLLTAMQIRRYGLALEKRETPRRGQGWAASLVGDRDAGHAMLESKTYDFGLSGEFDWMSRVLNIEKAPSHILDRGIEKLRWERAGEIRRQLRGEETFNLEYILSYCIRFQIIRRRVTMTEEEGQTRLSSLSEGLVARASAMIDSEREAS